ncbi:hypothetical protein AGIG_G1919 [Arapaima gigas]
MNQCPRCDWWRREEIDVPLAIVRSRYHPPPFPASAAVVGSASPCPWLCARPSLLSALSAARRSGGTSSDRRAAASCREEQLALVLALASRSGAATAARAECEKQEGVGVIQRCETPEGQR